MTLQQVDGERVVDIHYHKGEQVSTRCVNDSGCKQLKTSYNGEAQHQKKGRSIERQLVALLLAVRFGISTMAAKAMLDKYSADWSACGATEPDAKRRCIRPTRAEVVNEGDCVAHCPHRLP